MRRLERKVLEDVLRQRMLKTGARVLVALSGGPDSVGLLLVLISLRPTLRLEIEAAHVNHRQRKSESEEDERFVRELCAARSIPLQVSRLSDRDLKGRGNREEQLRRLRYSRLLAGARAAGAVLATGHTLDDQVETFFMKAARGAGPVGLSAIFPVREVSVEGSPLRIVRPLLESTREEIVNYLTACGQGFREDSSNLDLSLDRNWVRHCLIPPMARRLNPNLLRNIGKSAALCRELADFMKRQADAALDDCLDSESSRSRRGPSECALDADRLLLLPTALRKEAVRRAIERAKGDLRGVSHRNVADVLRLLGLSSGKSVDLPGGLQARREFHLLRFARAEATKDFSVELSIPGEIFVREIGKRVLAGRTRPSDAKAGVLRFSLSADRVTVRNRRPGDHFFIRGRPRKLKDLFQDLRIPAGRRSRLLILESRGEIVWVEDLGVNPRFEAAESDPEWVEIEVLDETFQSQEFLNE